MRNIYEKLAIFMQGRYGFDSLNKFLLTVFFIIWGVNIIGTLFLWLLPFGAAMTVRIVVSLLMLATFGIFLFRFLSRNINKRISENAKFKKIFTSVKQWFSLNIRKFKERKEYKYVKCPDCKAQLRVKNIKGKHTICCPKCKKEFVKKI